MQTPAFAAQKGRQGKGRGAIGREVRPVYQRYHIVDITLCIHSRNSAHHSNCGVVAMLQDDRMIE